MHSPIVRCGLNEAAGSWKTNPILRRIVENSRSLKPTISCPSTLRLPPLALVRPAIARPIVVLPEPDSPTRPYTSPALMSKLTFFTAWKSARPNPPG